MTAARRMHLVAVWHVLRSPHPRTGDAGDHLVADEDGVLAFKDVERFVLSVMYVKRGSGATRARHFDSTENLLLMADLRRLGRRAGRRRTAELLAQFDLGDAATRVAGGDDTIPQPVEVGRIELRQVEPGCSVPGSPRPGPPPRLGRHAQVEVASRGLRPDVLPAPEPDEVVTVVGQERQVGAVVVDFRAIGTPENLVQLSLHPPRKVAPSSSVARFVC